MKVGRTTFDDAEMTALTEVSAPGLPPYPYSFLQDWSEMDVWRTLGLAQSGQVAVASPTADDRNAS